MVRSGCRANGSKIDLVHVKELQICIWIHSSSMCFP
uniref:F-box protein AT5G49610-like beta-propeller domain-containing protein n=1 Tax=Setaria italica TaxID=4555 RepID=K3YXP5_SETIT